MAVSGTTTTPTVANITAGTAAVDAIRQEASTSQDVTAISGTSTIAGLATTLAANNFNLDTLTGSDGRTMGAVLNELAGLATPAQEATTGSENAQFNADLDELSSMVAGTATASTAATPVTTAASTANGDAASFLGSPNAGDMQLLSETFASYQAKVSAGTDASAQLAALKSAISATSFSAADQATLQNDVDTLAATVATTPPTTSAAWQTDIAQFASDTGIPPSVLTTGAVTGTDTATSTTAAPLAADKTSITTAMSAYLSTGGAQDSTAAQAVLSAIDASGYSDIDKMHMSNDFKSIISVGMQGNDVSALLTQFSGDSGLGVDDLTNGTTDAADTTTTTVTSTIASPSTADAAAIGSAFTAYTTAALGGGTADSTDLKAAINASGYSDTDKANMLQEVSNFDTLAAATPVDVEAWASEAEKLQEVSGLTLGTTTADT